MFTKLLFWAFIVSSPALTFAQDNFPFNIVHDNQGKILRIDLPKHNIAGFSEDSGDDNTLRDLKESYREFEMSIQMGFASNSTEEIIPETKDDRETYTNAKLFLSKDFNPEYLNDPQLVEQISKAKLDFKNAISLRMLAAPYSPAAFDEEQALEKLIDAILTAAKQTLPLPPIFSIFEFVFDEYVEALKSRREFFQNQLLVILENDRNSFSNEEKSLIRSSIFYSRLDFIKLSSRKNARKQWATFGDKSMAEFTRKCQNYVKEGEVNFGSCFKFVENEIRNGLVKKSLFNKKTSLAFDSLKPYRVRNHRRLLLLIKLGAKLAPVVPGPLKSVFNKWINSQYVNQRKTEGLLFGAALQAGNQDLASWVLTNSANPLLTK